MSFESFNYAEKRVRSFGTREWKLWYSESDAGLAFRMLTKDSANDCYVSLTGTATLRLGDTPIQEDDNEDAYPTDQFYFADADGSISIYLELEDRSLAWVVADGVYGTTDCSFQATGPLMPEVAG